VLASLLILTQPNHAQESPPAEKIRDIAPDEKLAMRILYEAEANKQLIESEKARFRKDFFRNDQSDRVSDAASEE
jgi:hypothetical protein